MESRPEALLAKVEQSLSATEARKESETDKQLIMRTTQDNLIQSLRLLTQLGIKHLSTITGLDAGEMLELNYQFWQGNKIITIRTLIPKATSEVDTCTPVLPGALLYEMEVHDMFGVHFKGHPWMDRKLLLPDNYPDEMPPPLLKGTSPEKIRKAVGIEK